MTLIEIKAMFNIAEENTTHNIYAIEGVDPRNAIEYAGSVVTADCMAGVAGTTLYIATTGTCTDATAVLVTE